MRWKALATVVVLGAAGATVWALSRNATQGVSYRFATIERGDLSSIVSSTGTLEAVTTVQVGTQVSGIIDHIYVDFNDEVRQGQVIARLDATLLETAVADAKANTGHRQADTAQAERDLARTRALFADQVVAQSDLDQALYALDVARANQDSAAVGLARAEQNLGYATIVSPISGTVIDRAVDVGQTVAASLSAPELFKIAADLSRMQILAAVDESDIGRLREGQDVRFTVQAFPDDSFDGRVRQVRLQSSTQDNVVNYTVVVDVDNPDRRLLPGMTATVEFLVETETDVLTVASSALRFRPTEEMLAALRERRGRERGEGSGRQGPGGAPEGRSGGFGFGGEGQRPADATLLWTVDEKGQLGALPVRTGITDGQATVIRGPRIEAGMQVIVGVSQGEKSGFTNPFQMQQPTSGPRRPPVPGM